jgi:ABC-2 type transport system permease protein
MKNSSFKQLFLMNLKLVYRNRAGVFWTILMPVFIYVALAVLPIGKTLGAQFSYSNYVLPGIIAMSIMQGGIYGLAYWMVDLKSRGVIKRFLVTPISQVELILSLLCARVLVILVQLVVLTLVGVVFFHASFAGNYFYTLLFALMGGFIFLLVGLLISTFANSYEAAAPITTAIGLPLTFLGNLFYSVDGLPNALRTVAHVLPITFLADGLRKVYLEPVHFNAVAKDFFYLALWLVAMLVIVIWRFRLEEEVS